MNNKFFQFVETYQDEIKAFFDALFAWIQAIIAKLTEGDAPEAAE